MTNKLYILILAIAAMVQMPATAYAQTTGYNTDLQLPSSGAWSPTIITTDQQVNLTGDVYLSDQKEPMSKSAYFTMNNPFIVVESGATLVINNNTNTDKSFIASNWLSYIFLVRTGGHLIINGNEQGRIIIDGGNDYRWAEAATSYTLTVGTNSTHNSSIMSSAIRSEGTLEMNYVTLQNASGTKGVIFLTDLAYSGKRGPAGPTVLNHCIISKCKGRNTNGVIHMLQSLSSAYTNADDVAFKFLNSTMEQCSGEGGIRTIGESCGSVYVTNSTFSYNYSSRYGGAIFWNAHGLSDTYIYIDGCNFTNNYARDYGGGISLESNFTFINNVTTVKNNRSLSNGGGICVKGYTKKITNDRVDMEFDINKYVYLEGNSANNGGGLALYFPSNMALDKGSTFTTKIADSVIKGNTATRLGGGIYCINETTDDHEYQFDIDLYSGEISGNTAGVGGGGIYAGRTDIINTSSAKHLVSVSNNRVVDGGGGGIFVRHGSLFLDGVSITDNVAERDTARYSNGGGIRVEPGHVTLKNCDINNNKCENIGGGAFVYYNIFDTKTRGNVTFEAGEMTGNESGAAGGGVAVYGNLDFTLKAVDIANNTSRNGGGIYTCGLDSQYQARVIYSSGLIYSNRATIPEGTAITGTTGYNLEVHDLQGVGGGVFIGTNSEILFDVSDGLFGIYGNLADHGADDIFAAGYNTRVYVPNVSEMDLTPQYYVRTNDRDLFWVEDYITNDTEYDKGTYGKDALWLVDPTNQRYRDVCNMPTPGHYYRVEGGITLTNYVSLTLGSTSAVTIEKEGMEPGDNAVFTIYRGEGENKIATMNVILTDANRGDDGILRKTLMLDDGTWTAVENSWTWSYNTDAGTIVGKFYIDTPLEKRVFHFNNTKNTEAPPHAEAVKVNIMKTDNSTVTP
jgi:predicted outer membrane repeat protein